MLGVPPNIAAAQLSANIFLRLTLGALILAQGECGDEEKDEKVTKFDNRLEGEFQKPVIVSMFGKFYEEIIQQYLVDYMGYESPDIKNGPTIWFHEETNRSYLEGLSLEELRNKTGLDLNETKRNIYARLKKGKTKCHPDGIVTKDGRYYVWEAKCEARAYYRRMPWWKIQRRIKEFDWLLGNQVWFRDKNRNERRERISGFILFWWAKPEQDRELKEHNLTIKQLKAATHILHKEFINEYIREALEKLIADKPPWYLKILMDQQKDIDEFFELCKGGTGTPTNGAHDSCTTNTPQ